MNSTPDVTHGTTLREVLLGGRRFIRFQTGRSRHTDDPTPTAEVT